MYGEVKQQQDCMQQLVSHFCFMAYGAFFFFHLVIGGIKPQSQFRQPLRKWVEVSWVKKSEEMGRGREEEMDMVSPSGAPSPGVPEKHQEQYLGSEATQLLVVWRNTVQTCLRTVTTGKTFSSWLLDAPGIQITLLRNVLRLPC